MSNDRTVHAMTAARVAIVRYDRAGKWYAEAHHVRTRLTLDEAVARAVRYGSHVYLGKPGGRMFDSRVAAKVKERAAA